MILAVGNGAFRIALVCMFPYVAVFAGDSIARAQSSDSFSVSDVGVDAVAETAIEAREIALASGQREALDRLIRRLTLRKHRLQIPELADAAIAPLVRGIEIEEEKTSSKRYLANLTVSFKKNEIRTLLRGNGIPFSETPSKPLLVLPVYEAAGARNLWDDPNPWLVAWQARSERDSLVPLVIPVGDLTDIATIGAQQALSGDDEPLAVIARRYGAADVLVAHAILRHDLAAGIPRLSVTLHRHGPESNSIVVENFSGVSRTMVDGLLERAAEEAASQIEENWKRLTLLRFEDEGMLSARVPLSGLVDWVEVRSRLSQAPEVSKVEILQVNREAAQVALHYFGSPQQLAVTLAQRDLDLVGEEGSWSVHLREKRGASAGGSRAADE